MKEISKNLPADLQPYERCLKDGPSVLNNAELLAVILRTGSVGENSVDLAARLLREGTLEEIVAMTVPQLTAIRGIGRVKAIQLQCIGELGKRLAAPPLDVGTRLFQTPDAIAYHYMGRLRFEKQEHVYLLLLDGKCRLIRELLLTKGTANNSLLSPRDVFVEAQRYRAESIVLLHNHPSGDPTPSDTDLSVTRQIKKAGELTDIPLLDHIIIGRNDYISLKERGDMDEQPKK